MNYGEEEDTNRTTALDLRREKIKDEFLDDTFNRAKTQPSIRPNVRKINPKLAPAFLPFYKYIILKTRGINTQFITLLFNGFINLFNLILKLF